MENKFNFKSAICTTREQSERLLALGLKKETADCHWCYSDEKWKMGEGCNSIACVNLYPKYYIPAWGLHRLLCLYNCHYLEFMGETEIASAYDIVIEAIESAITGGYFNEKYLV